MARENSKIVSINWDVDLKYGEAGEVYVNSLLTAPIKTVECKRDRRWIKTGNFYVETEFYSTGSLSWVSSGLTISRASHWSFILESMVITVPIEILIKAVGEYGRPIECEIPPNASRGYLLTINALIMAMKGGE